MGFSDHLLDNGPWQGEGTVDGVSWMADYIQYRKTGHVEACGLRRESDGVPNYHLIEL